jgi:hypothetical protein
MLADIANRSSPQVIVLTDRDWDLIRATNLTDAANLQAIVDARYRVAFTMTNFGEFSDTVMVYLRK